MPPGYPECRLYTFCSAFLPVTATLSALTTTTKSPTSTCGVYWALCLPRSTRAISVESRPRVLPSASTTYHLRSTSSGRAMKLFIILRRFYRLLIKGLSSGANSSIHLQDSHLWGRPPFLDGARDFGPQASDFGMRSRGVSASGRYRFLKYLAIGSWTQPAFS